MAADRATPTEAAIRRALQDVRDPASGTDIVSAGIVSGIALRDGNVSVSLEVDPRQGAALEPMRQAAEAAIRAVPGVLSATAILTAHRGAAGRPAAPPAAARSEHAAPQAPGAALARRRPVDGVRAIVAVASGKGGVGKSTTAVNLALALSARGRRVGILDADIYGPSVPRLLGVSGKPVSPDGQTLDPKRAYGLAVMSIGFLIDEDTPMIWRGPMVQSALSQMLRDVNWGELDVLIVDMPPGTGDAQLTMAQQVPLAGAVIVSTPQDLALIDARKGINMFRKVEVPILGVVENMSYFIAPDTGKRYDIFGHGGAKAEAERIGVPFLGGVPLTMDVREKSDAGTPVVAVDPDGAQARVYREIAEKVLAQLKAQAGAGGRT